MTHGEQRCVEIPETIRAKQLSIKVFYCSINILLAGWSLWSIIEYKYSIREYIHNGSMALWVLSKSSRKCKGLVTLGFLAFKQPSPVSRVQWDYLKGPFGLFLSWKKFQDPYGQIKDHLGNLYSLSAYPVPSPVSGTMVETRKHWNTILHCHWIFKYSHLRPLKYNLDLNEVRELFYPKIALLPSTKSPEGKNSLLVIFTWAGFTFWNSKPHL